MYVHMFIYIYIYIYIGAAVRRRPLRSPDAASVAPRSLLVRSTYTYTYIYIYTQENPLYREIPYNDYYIEYDIKH